MSTPTRTWILIAALFSLVAALAAALLKTKEGAPATKTITAAAMTFAATMTLCTTLISVTDLV